MATARSSAGTAPRLRFRSARPGCRPVRAMCSLEDVSTLSLELLVATAAARRRGLAGVLFAVMSMGMAVVMVMVAMLVMVVAVMMMIVVIMMGSAMIMR